MTLRELSNLYHINKKIEWLRNEIATVRSKTEKVTSIITGMPRGGTSIDYKDELLDLCAMLEVVVKESILEERRLLRYIEGIEDIQLQNIMRYRFVDCMTWNEVADNVGGNNTEYTVKNRLYRYLDKEKERH